MLALAIILMSRPALAQPSPKPPLTVAFARELAADYTKAVKTLAQQKTLAGRISARRDIARVLARGVSETQAFRLPMEANANPELKRLVGFGFEDLDERLGGAWDACVDEVRKGHGLDEAGRECLDAVWPIWIERRYVLAPPPAFMNAGGADASSKLYAATVAQLEATPESRELRQRVAAMALATTEHETVVTTLTPVSDGYDEAVTLAEAYRALERDADAERMLVDAIARAPRRPEAHHALAFLLKERLFEAQHETKKPIVGEKSIHARAWRHMLCYLCLRNAAVLPEPESAFEAAADAAEELDRGINGNGSHWLFKSDTPQPRPFLPNAVLPADLQAAAPPARTCAEAVAAALRPEDEEPKPQEAKLVEPSRDVALPRAAPHRTGCAGCAAKPTPSSSAWMIVLIAVVLWRRTVHNGSDAHRHLVRRCLSLVLCRQAPARSGACALRRARRRRMARFRARSERAPRARSRHELRAAPGEQVPHLGFRR